MTRVPLLIAVGIGLLGTTSCQIRRERQLALAIESNGARRLEIFVTGGTVRVAPALGVEINAAVHLTGRSVLGRRAQAAVDDTQATLGADPADPTALILRIDTPDFAAVDAEIDVTAPPTLDLTVRAGEGDLGVTLWEGSADVSTGRGSIQIAGARGAIVAHTDEGEVRLAADALDPAGINASTARGPIELTLPQSGGFLLDAATDSGTVQLTGLELPGGVTQILAPLRGGGPRVKLSTHAGMIDVSTR